MSSRAVRALVGLATPVAVAGTARAHSLGTARFEAPVPLSAVLAAGGLTVAVAAAVLTVRGGRVDAAEPVTLARVPAEAVAAGRGGLRLVGLAAAAAAILVGLLGPPTLANPALALVWAVGLHGIAVAAVLAGDPWPALSPWRTVYDGLCRLEGDVLAFREYPARLGVWPAVVGFALGVGVVGTLTVVPRAPRLTAVAVTLYAATMLVGAIVFGPAWLDRADPLAVFYRLLARVSPLSLRADEDGRTLVLRAPWRIDPDLDRPGLVAFVVVAVATVAVDGLASTRAFVDATDAIGALLGVGPAAGVVLYLGGVVAVLGAAWLTGRSTGLLGGDRRPGTGAITWAVAPVLVPVVAGIELAHGYPFVLEAVAGLAGAGDPLAWLSLPAIWASQVAIVVAGHVVAVGAASRLLGGGPDRTDASGTAADGDGSPGGPRGRRPATDRAAGPRVAPTVVLLVSSTVLAVWIVSRPVLA